jgi:hypothetical protein
MSANTTFDPAVPAPVAISPPEAQLGNEAELRFCRRYVSLAGEIQR